jgi:hypothetical protein
MVNNAPVAQQRKNGSPPRQRYGACTLADCILAECGSIGEFAAMLQNDVQTNPPDVSPQALVKAAHNLSRLYEVLTLIRRSLYPRED